MRNYIQIFNSACFRNKVHAVLLCASVLLLSGCAIAEKQVCKKDDYWSGGDCFDIEFEDPWKNERAGPE